MVLGGLDQTLLRTGVEGPPPMSPGLKLVMGCLGLLLGGSFINIAKLCIIIKGWPIEKIQVVVLVYVVLVYLYLSTTIIFILGKGAEKSIFSVSM